MSFVKVNDYYVNIDFIIYVREVGQILNVAFASPNRTEIILTIDKGSTEGANVMKAILEHC